MSVTSGESPVLYVFDPSLESHLFLVIKGKQVMLTNPVVVPRRNVNLYKQSLLE